MGAMNNNNLGSSWMSLRFVTEVHVTFFGLFQSYLNWLISAKHFVIFTYPSTWIFIRLIIGLYLFGQKNYSNSCQETFILLHSWTWEAKSLNNLPDFKFPSDTNFRSQKVFLIKLDCVFTKLYMMQICACYESWFWLKFKVTGVSAHLSLFGEGEDLIFLLFSSCFISQYKKFPITFYNLDVLKLYNLLQRNSRNDIRVLVSLSLVICLLTFHYQTKSHHQR